MPAKSINDWLAEGEQLFDASLNEYHDLASQIAELEDRLNQKFTEVNRLAQIIGKSPVEPRKVVTAQLVANGSAPNGENGHAGPAVAGAPGLPNSPASIARALQGRGLGR